MCKVVCCVIAGYEMDEHFCYFCGLFLSCCPYLFSSGMAPNLSEQLQFDGHAFLLERKVKEVFFNCDKCDGSAFDVASTVDCNKLPKACKTVMCSVFIIVTILKRTLLKSELAKKRNGNTLVIV